MKRGFTLIELIMVIVIIGILAAVAVPKFMDMRKEAKVAACQGAVGAIRTAITSYYAKKVLNGTEEYPPSIDDATLGSYFQDGKVPTGGWVNTSINWNNFYNNTTGVLNMTDACDISRF